MQITTHIDNLKNYKIYLTVEQLVSEFLNRKSYQRIDLPVLSPSLIPESYLEVFETEFQYLGKKEKLYLTPSPELFLKRLIADRVGSCYFLGKAFRNSEPSSPLHSFEFTMLEFYKVGVNYMGLMEEILELLRYINKKVKSQKLKVNGFDSAHHCPERSRTDKSTSQKSKLIYQNHEISLNKWEKISVADAFNKYARINEQELFDKKKFIKRAKDKGYRVNGFSYEDLWSQIYVAEIEPNLGTGGFPTLIYDFPKEFAALAKINPDRKTTQRFEFYIAGIEIGDCYTELTDWQEQKIRFDHEVLKRRKEKKINHPVDKGFIETLKYGLPECAGIAIGFERLAMIFANVDSIDKLKVINID